MLVSQAFFPEFIDWQLENFIVNPHISYLTPDSFAFASPAVVSSSNKRGKTGYKGTQLTLLRVVYTIFFNSKSVLLYD